MKIKIEDKDKQTLIEALQAQIRFWLAGRHKNAAWLQEWSRKEIRAAIRILRAVRRGK